MLAIVDAETGELADRPDFMIRGFAHDETDFAPAEAVIAATLAAAAKEGIGDVHQLEQRIARDVGRWASRSFRRSPLIIPVVVDA